MGNINFPCGGNSEKKEYFEIKKEKIYRKDFSILYNPLEKVEDIAYNKVLKKPFFFLYEKKCVLLGIEAELMTKHGENLKFKISIPRRLGEVTCIVQESKLMDLEYEFTLSNKENKEKKIWKCQTELEKEKVLVWGNYEELFNTKKYANNEILKRFYCQTYTSVIKEDNMENTNDYKPFYYSGDKKKNIKIEEDAFQHFKKEVVRNISKCIHFHDLFMTKVRLMEPKKPKRDYTLAIEYTYITFDAIELDKSIGQLEVSL
jgi:hypothetical protein